MDRTTLLAFSVGNACGAVRHDYYFKTSPAAMESIKEMAAYAAHAGLVTMLRREYPDTTSKNIIVNMIDGKPYVIDGNRHCVSLLLVKPDLTFGELEALHPGILRIWQAGVEEGQNTSSNPYEVYIPADVDIGRIPNARRGMDYFRNPPAPTNIVPANFPADSEILPEEDRGRPLAETARALSFLFPGDAAEEEPFAYRTDGGTLYLHPVTGELLGSDEAFGGSLTLPVSINGHTLRAIGTDAFNRRWGLHDIHFSDALTQIRNAAFYGCDGLRAVVFPAGLETVGDDAFGSCVQLQSVTFLAGEKSLQIGGGAFARCPNLSCAVFLGDVNAIGDGAFYNCRKLMHLTFHSTLSSIGNYAFSGCSGLSRIILPQGLTCIKEGAFSRCDNLQDVYFLGTKAQWDRISIGGDNSCLANANLHCLSELT